MSALLRGLDLVGKVPLSRLWRKAKRGGVA